MRHSVGNYLADTKPAQPHTYKKFTENHPKNNPKRHQHQLKASQKEPKTNPKDHQNGSKIGLFDARGAHWTPRVKNVSKMTPNSWPRVLQGYPFSVRNRPWKSKKTLRTENNTSLTKGFENITKKYRNRTLPNLKKYGFVYTKRMFLKERLLVKK